MQQSGHGSGSKSADALKEAKRGVAAARDKAESIATDVKDSVASKAADIRDQAAEEVRRNTGKLADSGKNETGKIVRSLGRALEAGSKSLEEDGMHGTAGYVRAAGSGLKNAADEIHDLDTDGVGRRVEDFVRDRPMMTVGALALAGFAVAALFKSQSENTGRHIADSRDAYSGRQSGQTGARQ